jgi:hypothetical protein
LFFGEVRIRRLKIYPQLHHDATLSKFSASAIQLGRRSVGLVAARAAIFAGKILAQDNLSSSLDWYGQQMLYSSLAHR